MTAHTSRPVRLVLKVGSTLAKAVLASEQFGLVSTTLRASPQPRLILFVSGTLLAKADASHGGRLVLQILRHRNGRMVHHWVRPGESATPELPAPAPHALSNPDLLQTHLDRPEVQAMLRNALSAPQEFVGEPGETEDDEDLYGEDGDLRPDVLYRQTDWDDIEEAVNYLVATETYEGGYELTFDDLPGIKIGEDALVSSVTDYPWDESDESEERSKELWTAYAVSRPGMNWDAEYGGGISIVRGPERSGLLGDFRDWAENEGHDEDEIEAAEAHESELERQWRGSVASALVSAYQESSLPEAFRAKYRPDGERAGNGTDAGKAAVPAVPFGPQGSVTMHDLLNVCGIPSGASVAFSDVKATSDGLSVKVKASHKDLGIVTQERTIRIGRYDDGDFYRYVENDHFKIDPAAQGNGLGARALLAQAEAMQRLGFEHIRTHAYRNDSTGYNGYYTWAVLGYDADLPRVARRVIASAYESQTGEELPDSVVSLQDLLRVEGGRDLWKRYGDSVHARFDTTATSSTVLSLQEYVNAPRSSR